MRSTKQSLSMCCSTSFRFLIASYVLLFTLTTPAFAQKPAQVAESEGGILPWLIAAGICGVICISAFLNPKRSHQA